MINSLRPWLELARISNLPTVWTNVLAGWLLAGGRWDRQPLAWLLVGASLLYTAGMILNDAMDVKFDREHRPERPLPSGRVTVATAWTVSVAMLVVGFFMCVLGADANVWIALALVAAIVAYDLYHKPWAGSVLIMAACRTLLYLVAGSAVTGALSWDGNRELVLKALVLGCYIVGLSLSARESQRIVTWLGFPRSFWLVILPLGFAAGSGNLWLNLVLGACFVAMLLRAAAWLRRPPPSNIGRGVGLMLAGIVVVDALAVTSLSAGTALVFAASMPLLLLWQRKIAAT